MEVEEAALAELERELEQRWGESWQIALYILFVSQRGESMTVTLSETKFQINLIEQERDLETRWEGVNHQIVSQSL